MKPFDFPLMVMIFFQIYWLTKFPTEVWETMIFKERTKMDIFAGIVFWIFVAGSSFGMYRVSVIVNTLCSAS